MNVRMYEVGLEKQEQRVTISLWTQIIFRIMKN
jgi:hypothetical protein